MDDKKENITKSDSMCRKTILVNRLPFFGRFGISMSKLLALTYHWAIQSDIAEVMKDVEVNVYTVRSVWRMLQEVCGVSVALKSSKLGGTNCSVEFGIAQLGRFLIVGVYDRRTGLTRMKAMSIAVGLNASVFLKTIESWLHKKSLVISNDAKLSKLSTIGLQHVLVKSSSSEAAIHTDNITDYLRKQLSSLFGEFAVNQLKIDTIQGFLDELQWRERFDTSPKECFWNILKHITDKTGNQGSAFELEQINSLPVSNSNQRAVLKRILNDEDNESNKKQKVNGVDVILDEYYYARLEPQISIVEKNKDKVYQFKCQLCKKYIDNNIKVMKHMNGHIENSRQKNLDLGDLTQCKYCYRKFETPYSMQCHIEAIHFQSNALACRICNQAFSEVALLVNHMKMIHCQAEMPYACSICKYRSSFHSDVLEHFQQYHNGSDEIMCHYCLKIFQIKFSVRGLGYIQNFYDHLHKHQCKSSSKNCPSCCLTFLNIQDLRIHKLYDHQSMKSVSGVVPIKSSSAEPIIVTDPHIKPSNNTNCDIIIDNEEINRSKNVNTSVLYHSSKSISLALSIANEMIGALCFECKNIIEKDHFKKFSVCVICHYSTNCNKAFMNHLVNHECNSEKLQIKSSFNFNCPMFCICGFSHFNGDVIAAHLSYCKKNSCYCSKQDVLSTNIKTETAAEYFDCPSAFFPPLVVLDEDEEESINESFAKLSASNILFEEEEKILPIDESIFEDQILKEEKDDRPNMLNALGLVRKKSALPPGILTVNDENIEDTVLSLGSDLSQYKSPVTKSDDDNQSIELSTENLTDDQETVMDVNLNNIEINNNKPQIQQTEENMVES